MNLRKVMYLVKLMQVVSFQAPIIESYYQLTQNDLFDS